ncbi:hypothetical protein PROVALCAL_03582 [Providencia alcalifaciens DSM 30120]|uniref:Uncharacterized protein n=1 Tax=Providencia alcalifaciens DSM 30120 TaxID=520999 RepID=B6XJM4_9GAMM|nr:hypothetical protein PROVALCAL_03582 [Providencia alcalifaciens DSM 30120]
MEKQHQTKSQTQITFISGNQIYIKLTYPIYLELIFTKPKLNKNLDILIKRQKNVRDTVNLK